MLRLEQVTTRAAAGAALHVARRCYISPRSPHSVTASSSSSGDKKVSDIPLNITALRKWEDEYHLGRSLSKSTVNTTQQTQWKMQLEKKSRTIRWNHKPVDEAIDFYKPEYEFVSLDEIHKRSYSTNVLLEIRDVRLPGTSHHPSFTRLARHRTHLICYTHADTIDAETRDRVRQWTTRHWNDSHCVFVDARETRTTNDSEMSYGLLYRWLLQHVDSAGGVNTALTVGMPNTGKSSVLLALLRYAKVTNTISKTTKIRNKQKSKSLQPAKEIIGIEDRPGKTRELTEYLIREKPRAYFLDVPGMSPPPFFFREEFPEAWFAMGATNLLLLPSSLQNDVWVRTSFCDYVLYVMNRNGQFDYVTKLKLDEPTDDIQVALSTLNKRHLDKLSEDKLQLKRCETFLKLFNTGNFGSIVLDDLSR